MSPLVVLQTHPREGWIAFSTPSEHVIFYFQTVSASQEFEFIRRSQTILKFVTKNAVRFGFDELYWNQAKMEEFLDLLPKANAIMQFGLIVPMSTTQIKAIVMSFFYQRITGSPDLTTSRTDWIFTAREEC